MSPNAKHSEKASFRRSLAPFCPALAFGSVDDDGGDDDSGDNDDNDNGGGVDAKAAEANSDGDAGADVGAHADAEVETAAAEGNIQVSHSLERLHCKLPEKIILLPKFAPCLESKKFP